MKRAITPEQRERLHEQARRDRQHAESFECKGRLPSVLDPIDAEIYRIRCELYCALADGEYAAPAFAAAYERGQVAVKRYNARQEALFVPGWRTGITGHIGVDEAWRRLRHALTMYRQIVPSVCGRQLRAALRRHRYYHATMPGAIYLRRYRRLYKSRRNRHARM